MRKSSETGFGKIGDQEICRGCRLGAWQKRGPGGLPGQVLWNTGWKTRNTHWEPCLYWICNFWSCVSERLMSSWIEWPKLILEVTKLQFEEYRHSLNKYSKLGLGALVEKALSGMITTDNTGVDRRGVLYPRHCVKLLETCVSFNSHNSPVRLSILTNDVTEATSLFQSHLTESWGFR